MIFPTRLCKRNTDYFNDAQSNDGTTSGVSEEFGYSEKIRINLDFTEFPFLLTSCIYKNTGVKICPSFFPSYV